MQGSVETSVSSLVRGLVSSGATAAAVGLVGGRDTVVDTVAAGRKSCSSVQAPTISSLFDLASLSKPLPASLALVLHAAGQLALETQLGEIWHAVSPSLQRVTLEDLLRHRAGLEAWAPLYAMSRSPDEAVTLLLSGRLSGAPSGTYSDLGYILWGRSVERALGIPLGRLLREELLVPLGLTRDVRIGRPDPRRLVDCQLDPRTEREMARSFGESVTIGPPRRGEAQDGNARFWGTYAGHAGLFGSARGLWKIGAEWLRPRVLNPGLIRQALRGRGRLRLGWWARRVRGSAGAALGSSAFGHTGFTGGSLWVDPDQEMILVLLAHRLDSAMDLAPWRRSFHRLAMTAPTAPRRS